MAGLRGPQAGQPVQRMSAPAPAGPASQRGDGLLSLIFSGCEGLIEIRPIPPGGPPLPGSIQFFSSPDDAESYARSLDGKSDVYFGAGTRMRSSGTKADVQEIPGLWADCDTSEAVAKLPTFRFRPTIEVQTSPGRVHAWWLFKEPTAIDGSPTVAKVEGTLRGIAAVLGSDQTVAEIARVMRMPGTRNVKRSASCRVLRSDGPRYDLADFIDAGIFQEHAGSNGQGPGERLDTAAALAGVPEGKRDQELFRLACKFRSADLPQDIAEGLVVDAAGNCEPPFPAEEAKAKVTWAYSRYPAGTSRAEKLGELDAAMPDDPPVASWPEPPAKAAYHGVLGEIVQKIEPQTEADPVAILGQLLVGFGNLIGGAPFYRVEGTKHYTKENLVLIGRTAGGRKGTAWDQARSALAAVDDDWTRDRVQGGLSTGEGLIHAVRDKREVRRPVMEKGRVKDYTLVEEDPGVEDKRLLAMEAEFARVLRVMAREGSTLSTVIREAWDRQDLRVMTKAPATATGTHISIVAHITTEELLRHLQDTEAASGFGNRFLWIAVKRARLLAEGGRLDVATLEPLLLRLRSAADAARKTSEMTRDAEAAALWRKEYERLSTGRPGLLGAMLSRAEAHVLRLSMIFALADASRVIGQPHLKAALALWDYCERSAGFVFGNSLGDPTADDLLRALRAAPDGLTRSEMREHFGRNKSSAEITRALGVLARQGIAHLVVEKQDVAGRPTERWRAGRSEET